MHQMFCEPYGPQLSHSEPVQLYMAGVDQQWTVKGAEVVGIDAPNAQTLPALTAHGSSDPAQRHHAFEPVMGKLT